MTNPDDRSSGGTADYNQPATQQERLAEVLRDRALLKETTATVRKGPPAPRSARGWIDGAPETSTYFAEAGLDDEDLGGRFRPGRSFDPVPRQPPDSPWAADPCGIEPPLGVRVDELPDQITLDGFNARGLPDWQYGPCPTEQHSSYDTGPGPSASGPANTEVFHSLASVSAEGPAQLDTAVGLRRAFSQPQPLEPDDVPTEEKT